MKISHHKGRSDIEYKPKVINRVIKNHDDHTEASNEIKLPDPTAPIVAVKNFFHITPCFGQEYDIDTPQAPDPGQTTF